MRNRKVVKKKKLLISVSSWFDVWYVEQLNKCLKIIHDWSDDKKEFRGRHTFIKEKANFFSSFTLIILKLMSGQYKMFFLYYCKDVQTFVKELVFVWDKFIYKKEKTV